MSKKLTNPELRKIVYAFMNASDYMTKVLNDLLAELDGRSTKAEEETEEVESEEVEEVQPKKGKKGGKKAKVEEVEAEEVEAEEGEDDLFADEEEEEGEAEVTVEEVRKVVKAFAKKHGKAKALKLLGKFKVTSIPDLKKSQYAQIVELANKHLK